MLPRTNTPPLNSILSVTHFNRTGHGVRTDLTTCDGKVAAFVFIDIPSIFDATRRLNSNCPSHEPDRDPLAYGSENLLQVPPEKRQRTAIGFVS
jgi:hypothetical protein